MDADLGAGLRLRTLTSADVDLVVEATSTEVAPALWGPNPPGPYSARDAATALREWDPAWAHCEGGLSRVWVEIHPDNLPSRRLAGR